MKTIKKLYLFACMIMIVATTFFIVACGGQGAKKYTVQVVAGEGYNCTFLSWQTNDRHIAKVEENNSVTFNIEFENSHDISEVVVKADGEVLIPLFVSEDGLLRQFQIDKVTKKHIVTVEGLFVKVFNISSALADITMYEGGQLENDRLLNSVLVSLTRQGEFMPVSEFITKTNTVRYGDDFSFYIKFAREEAYDINTLSVYYSREYFKGKVVYIEDSEKTEIYGYYDEVSKDYSYASEPPVIEVVKDEGVIINDGIYEFEQKYIQNSFTVYFDTFLLAETEFEVVTPFENAAFGFEYEEDSSVSSGTDYKAFSGEYYFKISKSITEHPETYLNMKVFINDVELSEYEAGTGVYKIDANKVPRDYLTAGTNFGNRKFVITVRDLDYESAYSRSMFALIVQDSPDDYTIHHKADPMPDGLNNLGQPIYAAGGTIETYIKIPLYYNFEEFTIHYNGSDILVGNLTSFSPFTSVLIEKKENEEGKAVYLFTVLNLATDVVISVPQLQKMEYEYTFKSLNPAFEDIYFFYVLDYERVIITEETTLRFVHGDSFTIGFDAKDESQAISEDYSVAFSGATILLEYSNTGEAGFIGKGIVIGVDYIYGDQIFEVVLSS